MSLPIQVTQVIIRRVQNGFVIDAINEDVQEQFRTHALDYKGPQRACYVAADIPEIAKLLQSFVDLSDTGWIAATPMPVMTVRRTKVAEGPTES